EHAMEPIPIILALLVMGCIIAYAILDGRKRREMMSAYAKAKGYSYDPDKDRDMDDRYRELSCLCKGHSRFAHNIMRGQHNDRTLLAFDYHYATGHGKNRKTHRFSAVILQSPVPLKPLFIRREHAFDKVTEFFGADDIDFESAEFSSKFYVKSPDKRWAYDVIHQRMMEYLLAAPQFGIEFDSGHIIAWKSKRFAAADFDAASELIEGILARMPDYLLEQMQRSGDR
ncbi:MAG: hypothetical protein ABIF77_13750, partial [bacterium]